MISFYSFSKNISETLPENHFWKGHSKILLENSSGVFIPVSTENNFQETIQYHLENSILLSENYYRMYSENYFNLFNYIRENYSEKFQNDFDKELLDSSIGVFEWFSEEHSFVPLDVPFQELFEETPELNKPKRGGPKKFYVYVKTPSGRIKKVTFGDTTGLSVKFNDPERRKSFAARHNCSEKNDKTTSGYWSCRLPRFAKSLGLTGGGSGFW